MQANLFSEEKPKFNLFTIETNRVSKEDRD